MRPVRLLYVIGSHFQPGDGERRHDCGAGDACADRWTATAIRYHVDDRAHCPRGCVGWRPIAAEVLGRARDHAAMSRLEVA